MSQVFLFYFILLASPKKANKQTERTLAGTPQQLWSITAGPDTNKKNKKREIPVLKNTVIQEKLQLQFGCGLAGKAKKRQKLQS